MREKSYKTLVLVALASLLVSSDARGADCNERLFTGFDTRLTVSPLGQVPLTGETVVGFEVIKDKAVVAFRHRVLALTKTGMLKWISPDRILSIADDGNGRLLVQTTKGIVTPTRGQEFEPLPELTRAVPGTILDSGTANILAVRIDSHSQMTTITAVRPDASLGSSLEVQEPVRALSWNQNGLSVIVGSGLMIGPTAEPKPSLLESDEGFKRAQDSCLAGTDRAVVALPNIVVLITHETALVVVGISARTRCTRDSLYLLDLRTGIVAKITGIEKIGHKDADQQHAKSLVSNLSASAARDNPRFMEAARIIGCTQAAALVDGKKR